MSDRRPSWLIIALAGIALSAAVYLWVQKSPTPSERAAASHDGSRLVALEREVQGLRAATALLATRQAGTEPMTSGAVVGSDTLARGREEQRLDALDGAGIREEIDPEEEARRDDEERARFLDELSRRVDTEPVEGAWRHDTESGIRRLISEHLGSHVTVSEATCASSLCRVKLSHPEWPHIPQDKMFKFDTNRASLGTSQIQFDTRKDRATTLYFMRDEPSVATQEQ